MKIRHYLKHRFLMCKRHFFRILSRNRDFVQTHCNDLSNLFHFACQKKVFL